MRKFFFYFIWKSDKLETFLNEMEEKGFRLDHVSFRYFFSFKRAKPKSVRYVDAYTFMKDCGMMQYSYDIRRNNAADIVPVYHSGLMQIHRVPDRQADLSDFETGRNRYMRGVLLQKIVFLLFILMGAVCAFLKSDQTAWGFLLPACMCIYLIGADFFGFLYLWRRFRLQKENRL